MAGSGDGATAFSPDPLPMLPPGQHEVRDLPVMHYGPVPRRRPGRWDFRVDGATADGEASTISMTRLRHLTEVEVVAGLHCATRWSVLGLTWTGWRARDVVDLAPPRADVEEVLVFAEFGYAAVVRLEDLLAPDALLATALDHHPLTDEHGGPVRLILPRLYSWKGPKWLRGWTYLESHERGFWEERGYHRRARVWDEERYAYQE